MNATLPRALAEALLPFVPQSSMVHQSLGWLPAKESELDAFYGVPASREEVEIAIGKASSNFDSGELADVCAIAFEQIADLIAADDATDLGNYIMFLRRQRIADIASRSVYGRVGLIFATGVKV